MEVLLSTTIWPLAKSDLVNGGVDDIDDIDSMDDSIITDTMFGKIERMGSEEVVVAEVEEVEVEEVEVEEGMKDFLKLS